MKSEELEKHLYVSFSGYSTSGKFTLDEWFESREIIRKHNESFKTYMAKRPWRSQAPSQL